jgi:Flp pilus assembly protein TadG
MYLVKKFREFGTDTDGNIAMMTGLTMTAVIIGVASAVDYSLASNNRQKSQDIADSLALAAALRIEQDGVENLKSMTVYAPGKTYSGKELNLNLPGLVDGTDISVEFVYNLGENEVTAVVKGKSQVNFMQFAGVDGLDFTTSTTVEFPAAEFRHPASIAMVIDNSNSMWFDETPAASWDQDHFDNQVSLYQRHYDYDLAVNLARQVPTGRERRPSNSSQRMDSLKAAMISLNETLSTNIDENPEQRFLRMGLSPFNDGYVKSKESPMNWGVIPETKINAMVPSGGTDVSAGLDVATNWLEAEPSRYEAEVRPDLKRYIILMTDGQDTSNTMAYINKAGTAIWRGEVKRQGHPSSRQCLETEQRTYTTWWGATRTETTCVKWETDEEARDNSRSGWYPQIRRQTSRPDEGRNWQEVEEVLRTHKLCDSYKEKGWDVYTVAYALQPGVYYSNLPGRATNHVFATSPQDVENARDLLKYCATSDDHFLSADNAEELSSAFEEIGISIADDTKIRIKS